MDERLQRAFDLVDGKTERILEHFRTVISVDTSVPPGKNYDTLVDAVEPHFTALGFQTERVIIPAELLASIPLPLEGPRVNLVATRQSGNGKEPVSIYAHMDVVPIEEGWEHDPFGADLVDGKIYGRGTSDMKGAIAALLTAIEVLDEAGIEPNFDLNVLLCTDEEIGGYPGVWHLAKEGYVKGHMLCLEGGQDPRIGLASAGSVDVTITTHGKSGHSGMNFLSVNAIDAMLPIMNELAALKAEVERRESDVPGMPHPLAPSTQMTPMFNFAIINAGVKSNIVPSTCTLLINRRYIPDETYEQVTSEILAAVERGQEKSNAVEVTVDFFNVYPAMRLNADGPHMRRMREAAKLVHGYTDEEFLAFGVSGSTDMANVQQVMGWDDIPFRGPGRVDSRAHGADEFVRLDDVKSYIKELIYYLSS
jgi:succinyl-diaminopimelate desuccinylase